MNKKWFTYLVLAYLFIATAWWTLLLFQKNEAEFSAKKNNVISITEVKNLEAEYKRQKLMIIGESVFLGASLMAGIWIIFRSHTKELQTIKQQNNFLMAVTHELKSPLSAIDLTLQTIQNRKLEEQKINRITGNARNEKDYLL